ncbi:MAG: recombinase family protein [Alphaproteobacteria bacterium]|nr:recombinase family protein [Alphaproteobacteria bacterium]
MVIMKTIVKTCAIYTRKSTDERLDMEFNTLDAQREACEAYIMSQRSEGWRAAPTQYDDGGFSGGSLERPALERLIEDIKAGRVNIVVVYKIDRLTRSLADFAKLVDVFDEHGVTFVSVTQSFNTTTSMGRLTLNVLLSFAQFEREVSGERIRDKIAASKAKGMWQGGRPPFGFDIGDRRLITNDEDAHLAKKIFELYLKIGCVRALAIELKRRGIKSRRRTSQRGFKYGGEYFSRGALHALLTNPVYIGKISHKGTIHEGLHDAIIPQALWDAVQNKLQDKAANARGGENHRHTDLLTGLIFDEYGRLYTPVFTRRRDRDYRYYCNEPLARDKHHPDHLRARFPAHEIESFIEQAVRGQMERLSGEEEGAVLEHMLKNRGAVPAYDLIRTCVKRVTVYFDHLVIAFKPDGFKKLVDKYLRVSVTGCAEEFEITVPFQTKRGRDGAMVIEAEGRDVLDLPPEDLKRLVQGIAWRDEHFAGTHIKDIATRENCSSRYVRNRIMASFEIPY